MLDLKTRIKILAAIILLSGGTASGQYELKGSIVDDDTGQPASATVSLITEEGDVLAPKGPHDLAYYLDKKRWYVDGDFSVVSPVPRVTFEIRRGLETLPIVEEIDLSLEGNQLKQFRLKRWRDMYAMGYLSGDSHIHFMKPGTAHLQMKAEDLNVANLLTSDFTDDLEIFSGELDKVSTEKHFVYVGQEIRDWQLGHANLLELKYIVQPLDPFGGSFFAMGSNPNLLLSPRLEEAHKQGASNVWAHFSNLPGLESAIAFPLGLIDAIELMTYDDPTMLPSHWTVWDYSELQDVDFPPMRGMDIYYQYLNAGFQIPITAGTDKMGDNIPVGSNRNYVRIEGDKVYESWVEGMKKGQGFITNAPLIEFSADGHLSGETVEFSGEKSIRVGIKAVSLLPFGRAEIVVNGKTVAWEYMEDFGKKKDLYSAQLEIDVNLTESTWIAGRVTSLDNPQLLPRNLTVFAHSNPVYFLREGKPVYMKGSVEYLLNYLESGRNWITNNSDFATIDEKKQALEYLKKAEDVLRESGKYSSFFPVMCWDPQHGWNNQYEERSFGLESMRDCNFTIGGFVQTRDIPECEKLGLKVLAFGHNDTITMRQWNNLWDDESLSDRDIKEIIRKMVQRTGNSEAVLGFFICDEPGASMFPRLAKAVEYVHLYAPGKLAYINLFPDYATLGAPDQSQLETESYEEYLERYLTEVKPEVLSYDNYQVQYSMDLEEESKASSYYHNLLDIRRKAIQYGIPFWNIVSSNQIRPFTTIPSQANMNLQAYTTLAAGGRGVTWYTYYSRGYAYAPIDEDGNKTPTWHMLREVNRQLAVIGPIMNRLNSTGVYFTSPAPVADLPVLPGELIENVEAQSPMMVGEFRGVDGSEYIMLVNLSLNKSVKFKIRLRDEHRVPKAISSTDGRLTPLNNEEGSWLVAGKGILIKL